MNRLTVVLSVHNGLPFVRDTIRSLQLQDQRDFLAYVVDNRSTDGSREFLDSIADDRFRVIRYDQDLGIPRNWNRAMALVDTPYFALVHQDDVYAPEFLRMMLELIERYPRAFIGHCKVTAIDEAGNTAFLPAEHYKERFWPPEDPYERSSDDAWRALCRGNYVVMSSVIYHTAAVRQIGPFAERYRFVADWDYWLRGVLASFTLVGTHQRLVKRRWHPDMATRRVEADLTRYREELEVARWIAEAAHNTGVRPAVRPDYSLVANTVLNHFTTALAQGRDAEARRVLQFATDNIPDFRGSPRHLVARIALLAGRTGGRLLDVARAAYLQAGTRRPVG